MADMLSRNIDLAAINVDSLKSKYKSSKFYEKIVVENEIVHPAFSNINKDLFNGARLCVVENDINQIFKDHHESQLAVHRGSEGTFELIARNYYWSGMYKNI